MRIILNFSINPLLSIFATFLTFIHFMIVAIPFYMAIIPLIKYVKENNLKWTDYIILSNFKNLEMVSFKKDLSDVVFLSNDLLLQEIKELEKIR